MKTYIQPTTQITKAELHTIICISVNEGGEDSAQKVWDGADAPKRKIGTLYI